MVQIERLDAVTAQAQLSALVVLLQDTVESGASVGFLPPLTDSEAREYWLDVLAEVQSQSKILLAAYQDDQLVGSVQLALATRANGSHRAEVQKLFVLRKMRNQGLGRLLMSAIEDAARQANRSLLVLDTRQGDV